MKEIETITTRVEKEKKDIAPNYNEWRDLGFALADTLGENGRQYYHRLSQYHPNYNQKETNKQYTNCLKSKGHGITIKTLYHLAKSAGIDISPVRANLRVRPTIPNPQKPKTEDLEDLGEIEEMEETEEPQPLPTIPQSIYQNLPNFLKQATAKATTPEDKDILLLGSIVAISPCLPNIYGIYAERTVYPNLYLFVTAQASAGKGKLTLCRKLIEPIHKALREQSKAERAEYQQQLSDVGAHSRVRPNPHTSPTSSIVPDVPPMRMLIIPANNSATGLFQILNDNKGIGLIFETEGDTLAQTFKSEHGNYSDGFRKAFHHETISYNRRKDREYVELETPRLSALLSGTPKQVSTLIPNAENGLFSRFIFYYMNILPVWKNVFAGDTNQTLDDYFKQLGKDFHNFHKILKVLPVPLQFTLTKNQQQQFNDYFSQTQSQYLYLCGIDYIATIRRLGLITFRIAMILTTLRIMETPELLSAHAIKSPVMSSEAQRSRDTPLLRSNPNATPSPILNYQLSILNCSDTDFQTAIDLVKTMVIHAAKIHNDLPAETKQTKTPNQKQQFLEKLPKEFSRQDYLSTAQTLNIPPKTAEKHITKFKQNNLINHYAHDRYKKN